ncbi:MAG: DNA repair protein RecO [Magnetospirillum sp. WYHS-4]
MEWSDDGIVLGARRHGESGAVVHLLTREHGRHAGLVRGGARPKLRAVLQPGTLVQARWRGRLAEHLGSYDLEPVKAYAADLLDKPMQLAGLTAACAVAETALPERESHPAVFEGLRVLLEAMGVPWWPSIYVRWEVGVLKELGFGLDLSRCAATGANDRLAYVSPKSGRAVSLSAGEPYRQLMLPLPGFLLGGGGAGDAAQVADGLRLTGFFLERHVYHGELPPARDRLADRLRNLAHAAPPAPDLAWHTVG